jgi:hypothetical protein
MDITTGSMCTFCETGRCCKLNAKVCNVCAVAPSLTLTLTLKLTLTLTLTPIPNLTRTLTLPLIPNLTRNLDPAPYN